MISSPTGDLVLVHWRTILQPFSDLQPLEPLAALETLPLFVKETEVDGRIVVVESPVVDGI